MDGFFNVQKKVTSDPIAGVHIATLMDIFKGSRDYGEGQKDTLCFSFQTQMGDVVNRTVGASLHDRSKCFQIIKELNGGLIPSREVLMDAEKAEGFVKGFIGRKFKIQVEASNCGRYNNLIGIVGEVE